MPAERSLRLWRNALFTAFGLSGLTLSSWDSRVPAIRSVLHVNAGTIGLMLLGASTGAILGLIVSPTASHRLGMRRGMVAMTVTAATGGALIGLGTSVFHSIPVVVLGLVLVGFGNGGADVMMNVSAATVEKRIGRTLMPMMHACFSIGTVVGAAIGAGMAALGVPVGWHLCGAAVVIGAGIVIAVRYIPDRVEAAGDATVPPHPSWRERLAVWRDPRLVVVGLVLLAMSFAEGAANDWVALASVEGHGRSQAEGAAILDVFVLAMACGRGFGGLLVDRVGRVWAIRLTAALGVIGLLFFIVGTAPWAYVGGVAAWGLGASLGFPLGMSAAADGETGATARVSSVAIIGYCAFLVGPPLIGFLAQRFGLLNALYAILVLLVVAFFAAPAMRPPRPTAIPSAPPREG